MEEQQDKYPGGRPTTYKPEYATTDYLEGYFDECKEEEKLISECGYAVYIGTTEVTLHSWSKKFPEFLKSLGLIKQKSKEMLITKGLVGKYRPNMAKFVLSACHGLREGTDVTSGGESITIKLPEKFKDM